MRAHLVEWVASPLEGGSKPATAGFRQLAVCRFTGWLRD